MTQREMRATQRMPEPDPKTRQLSSNQALTSRTSGFGRRSLRRREYIGFYNDQKNLQIR